MRLRSISLCVSEFHGFVGLHWKGSGFFGKVSEEEEMLDFFSEPSSHRQSAAARDRESIESQGTTQHCVSLLPFIEFFQIKRR